MSYVPPTQTKLANIALDMLGVSSITDIAERSVNAEKVRLHWDLTRDELLRAKDWNFATEYETLVENADEETGAWDYAYTLPTDYLKALEWNGRLAGTSQAKFEITSGHLLCDDTASDSDLQLKYTRRVEIVAEWDASFCQAFAHALAAAVAPGLSTAPGLGERMRQRAEEIALQAAGPNNRETRPRAVLAQTDSGWLTARQGIDPYQ